MSCGHLSEMEACNICLEPPRFYHVLNCGHGACAVCLIRWVSIHGKCQTCRQPATVAIRVFGATDPNAAGPTDEETAAILGLTSLRPPAVRPGAVRPTADSRAGLISRRFGERRASSEPEFMQSLVLEYIHAAVSEGFDMTFISHYFPLSAWTDAVLVHIIACFGTQTFQYSCIPAVARSEARAILYLKTCEQKYLSFIPLEERTDLVCRTFMQIGILHHLEDLPLAFQTAEWFLSLTHVKTIYHCFDALTNLFGDDFWTRVAAVAPRMLTQNAVNNLLVRLRAGQRRPLPAIKILVRSGLLGLGALSPDKRTPELIEAALSYSSDALYVVRPADRTDALIASALETGFGIRLWKQLPEVKAYLKTHAEPHPGSDRPRGPHAHWRERQAAYTAATGNLVADPTAA